VWQVLVEDAVRLEALYPGQNATHIAQQQNIVVSSWSVLQERSANRREELHASCELQRFLTQVCGFTSKTEMCDKVGSIGTYAAFV
jgi:spectrin beta